MMLRAIVLATLLAPQPQLDSVRHDEFMVVGERAEYRVKFGIFTVGSGSLELAALDTVRGRVAHRYEFYIGGGMRFVYNLRDSLMSWIDTATFASLRFRQRTVENGSRRLKVYEIYPERQRYKYNEQPETTSVADPLDEVSLLQYVRTLDLEVGREYRLERYFRPDRNPVILKVLRRETVEVPAGKFDAIVVQPIIKASGGIFRDGGQAEVWIAQDSTRAVVKVSTRMSAVGSLTMEMRKYTPGTSPPRGPPE